MNFVGQNPSAKLNSPRRTRTADTMVNSHLLYQLSYGGMLMLIITYPVRNCKLNLTFLQNFQKDYFFGNNGSARLVEALAGSVAPCAWLKARQNLLNYTPSQFQRQIKFRSPSDYRDVFSRMLLYLAPAHNFGTRNALFAFRFIAITFPPIQTTHQLLNAEPQFRHIQSTFGRSITTDTVTVGHIQL